MQQANNFQEKKNARSHLAEETRHLFDIQSRRQVQMKTISSEKKIILWSNVNAYVFIDNFKTCIDR